MINISLFVGILKSLFPYRFGTESHTKIIYCNDSSEFTFEGIPNLKLNFHQKQFTNALITED